MAFHPFHAFRKHQKVLFAGLTILCMFIFVLQFGAGDLFSRLGMGRGGPGETTVATLYGKDVTQREFIGLEEQRAIANRFMKDAVLSSAVNAVDNTAKAVAAWDEPTRRQLEPVLNDVRQSFLFLAQGNRMGQQYYFSWLQERGQQVMFQLYQTQASLKKANKPQEAKQVLDVLQAFDDVRQRLPQL